ncbi:MAG: 1-phosphofructokinase family hexose kinase [Ruminococcaceae bacterium]|nr:1-phosphofructokinase family hexose kinase [Oscillospiraceae bacterium]
MIGTVTPNPCLDKTVSVKEFDLYRMNRARVLATDPSGKGINVSKTLAAMGAQTLCTGFDFTNATHSLLSEDLAACGIPCDFLTLPGELRVCTKIIDESRQHTIELNEQGAPIDAACGEALLDKIAEVAKRCDFLTLSGSLPQGLDKDFYARAVRRVKCAAPLCRTVVDAEGEALLQALAEGPFFIKPNIHEFESTFGCSIPDVPTLDRHALEVLTQYELGMICVSLGDKGAYIATRTEAYFTKPIKVKVRSLQGAGDALVAGICMALEKQLPLPEVLHYGVTLAAATIMTEGTRPGSRSDFEKLLKCAEEVQKIR